jgi:hypothetical protein
MYMTKTQMKALEAVTKWQDETPRATPEHTRAMIAGSMIVTQIPLTNNQLSRIDDIINE